MPKYKITGKLYEDSDEYNKIEAKLKRKAKLNKKNKNSKEKENYDDTQLPD